MKLSCGITLDFADFLRLWLSWNQYYRNPGIEFSADSEKSFELSSEKYNEEDNVKTNDK